MTEKRRLNELALFAGAGGGLLASRILGWNTVCAVEIEDYCRRVLLQRQREGHLDPFPIWDDVRTFDGRPWRGKIDVISGGFPCQDISAAGKGEGLAGERSGLVFKMLRIIDEVRPRFVFAENSPLLRTRGLGEIVERLSCMGYVGRVGVLGARHVGAPHRRDRMWIVAHSDQIGRERGPGTREKLPGWGELTNSGRWATEPDMGRVANGVAHRMDRLKAIGNGQVPAVAALAWRILSHDLDD